MRAAVSSENLEPDIIPFKMQYSILQVMHQLGCRNNLALSRAYCTAHNGDTAAITVCVHAQCAMQVVLLVYNFSCQVMAQRAPQQVLY